MAADVAFRGRGYEHAVDVGKDRLAGVLSPVRAQRGETVGLRLLADGCLLFGSAPSDEAVPDGAGDPPARVVPPTGRYPSG